MKNIKRFVVNSAYKIWSAAEKKALERQTFALKRWERYNKNIKRSTGKALQQIDTDKKTHLH